MLNSFCIRLIAFFILLFIVTIPFPYPFLLDIGSYFSLLFEPIARWIGESIFQLSSHSIYQIISDSTGMYIHMLVLLLLAIVFSGIFHFSKSVKQFDQRLFYWSRIIACYFLAMQLFRYGFDKVFKQQFYFPEPNTLYTPLAYLNKDILYWSTMGTSYSYTVLLGLVEVLIAGLLLFKKTRLIGGLLSIGVLINIVLVNFGFDISVKLYSLFLLLLSFFLVAPYAKRLYDFFFLNKLTVSSFWQPNFKTKQKAFAYSIAKALVIGLILLDTLSPYFTTGNFNDDLVTRPFLHGAYEIIEDNKNNNVDSTTTFINTNQIKRFFIHRKGYFIIQGKDDKMQDFKLEYDLKNDQLILTDHDKVQFRLNFTYEEANAILSIKGTLEKNSILWIGKKLNLSKLPIMDKGFNWTIDGFKY